MTVFAQCKQPKLISHKITVARILLNFHTVEHPQTKFPIKLPRSVFVELLQFELANFHLGHPVPFMKLAANPAF